MPCILRLLGTAIKSNIIARNATEDAKVVGVENWLGNFYPSGKILFIFLIRVC
jgi:hypothetical protein